MILPATEILDFDNGVLKLKVHGSRWQEVKALLKKDKFLKVSLSKPGKARTLPQNRLINGWIQIISMETGQDFYSLKTYFKHEAISRGYPFDTIGGLILPWSETRLNTEQATRLAETIAQEASELGIILPEGET